MNWLSKIVDQVKACFKTDPDRFLQRSKGVIHVGANTGQEKQQYENHGLNVVWIEPIPEVFEKLSTNVRDLPKQQAYQCLVTDQDDAEYEFNVANNNGASSSILDFHLHKEIWPTVSYDKKIRLRSVTLPTFVQRHAIELDQYDALILDTQGTELLILRGASEVLRHFKFIKTEVPDFESYAGCCQLADLAEFMTRHGYTEISRNEFARREGGGRYYDVVYRRCA